MNERLAQERQRLQLAWQQYVVSHGAVAVAGSVLESWGRSSSVIPPERVSAPVDDPDEVRAEWLQCPLEYAARPVLGELRGVAEEGEMIAAISDASGRLLWTDGSARMHHLARAINFIPGGRWDEDSVGTNALGLALRRQEAVRVFAAEHYVQAVHDWVCYSAPIRHPKTGRVMGVLDFSTTWEYTNPLGLVSVKHYAQMIEHGLEDGQQGAELRLRLCGPPQVLLYGLPLHLTPRQHELLAILALHPDGLTLDALHAHMYGDQPVSLSTLKSEVSTLRALLRGGIASRPYRLTMDVLFDVRGVEEAMLRGKVQEAIDLYGGSFLPNSCSPFLTYFRLYLDGALREAVLRMNDSEALWCYAIRFEDDYEILAALRERLAPNDPRLPVVIARFNASAST